MQSVLLEQWGNPSSLHTWGQRAATTVERFLHYASLYSRSEDTERLAAHLRAGPLFLVFLAFGAARRMFWGPRFGWRHMHMHHGPWSENRPSGPDFVPPMFAEWHKRAHAGGEKPTEETPQK